MFCPSRFSCVLGSNRCCAVPVHQYLTETPLGYCAAQGVLAPVRLTLHCSQKGNEYLSPFCVQPWVNRRKAPGPDVIMQLHTLKLLVPNLLILPQIRFVERYIKPTEGSEGFRSGMDVHRMALKLQPHQVHREFYSQ